MFAPLVSSGAFLRRTEILDPNSPRAIELTKSVTLTTLPTHHPVFDEECGVGLCFDIRPRNSRLIITGDTGWEAKVERAYRDLPCHPQTVLVPHVSTVSPTEARGALFAGKTGFYDKHLGIRGLGKLIDTVHPAVVILSEIGEELAYSVERLAKLVEKVYHCRCEVGWKGYTHELTLRDDAVR
jgi:hypothetical protein